jgi:membrane fusion protein, multidrug efflux system
VKVVGADGTVAQKRVTSDLALGGNWIVTSGLADGDPLIVSNFGKARPGMPVKVVPGTPSAARESAPSAAKQ